MWVTFAKGLSRKERKERKEMEGGNGATSGSGITQFAEGEPKRRKCANQIDEAGNLLWMAPVSGAIKNSREVRKIREVLKNKASRVALLPEKISRGDAESRRMFAKF